jgi:hypothetical protein
MSLATDLNPTLLSYSGGTSDPGELLCDVIGIGMYDTPRPLPQTDIKLVFGKVYYLFCLLYFEFINN